jgi:periplasmic copper chaperone A
MLRFAAIVLMSLTTLVSVAAAEQPVTVTNAWARATPGGATIGAAYVTIEGTASNSGDVLISVSTPIAGRAEIHTHIEEDGVMKMRKVEKIAVAAGEKHALAPGGDHIMLFDLKAPLKLGVPVPLTFTFEKSGAVNVTATVEAVGASGPAGTTAAGKEQSGTAHEMDGSGSGDGEAQH